MIGSRLILVLGILTGCVGPLHPSVEHRDLAANPAAQLRMPGAEELAHFQRERENTVEGPTFAFDRRMFGTQATGDEVVAFYDRELRRLGWAPTQIGAVMSTTDADLRSWCVRRMTFRLAIKVPDEHRRWVPAGSTYRTLFDAGLTGRDEQRQCAAG